MFHKYTKNFLTRKTFFEICCGMASLKNEQLSIPGGFQFYVADTKWSPAPFSSIDSITTQLVQHRQGRPDLCAKHGWSLDPAVVRREVVQYQVAVCQRNNWNDYLLGGSEVTVPFTIPSRSLPARARGVAAGVRTLVNWLDDGAPTVAQELANARAAVCTGGAAGEPCPMNNREAGWLEKYFTVPAQNAIKSKVEQKRAMKLETPMDDRMGVCTACDCPLSLKVWLPLDHILSKMPKESYDALHENCWIKRRDQPPTPTL